MKLSAGAVVAALLLFAGVAAAQLAVTPIPPKVDYFRFKARYVVLATNEIVAFDLVRPCFPVSGRDITGGIVGLNPYRPGGYFNGVQVFPKVTNDRHAIVVRVPYACEGQTTANGKVPKDLLPYTSWFENADDFTYGWLYASEDAYARPPRQIPLRVQFARCGRPGPSVRRASNSPSSSAFRAETDCR